MRVLKPNRNDNCPCNSGKKYKKCCFISKDMKYRRLSSSKSKKNSMIVIRGLPSIFIIVGFLAFFFGARGAYRAYDSVNWLYVQGVVTSSSVHEYEYDDSDGYDHEGYRAKVFYSYSLNEISYIGNRVAYGALDSEAYSIVHRYPVGKNINVYIKPSDPNVSVLEPGLRANVFVFPGIGLLFFTLGCLSWVFFPRAFATKK